MYGILSHDSHDALYSSEVRDLFLCSPVANLVGCELFSHSYPFAIFMVRNGHACGDMEPQNRTCDI